jgi:hypothetical protein
MAYPGFGLVLAIILVMENWSNNHGTNVWVVLVWGLHWVYVLFLRDYICYCCQFFEIVGTI